jgi:hypothetical protein
MTPQLAISPGSTFELEQACRRSGPPSFLTPIVPPVSCRHDQTAWQRIWTFPDARAAAAWNDDWERWLVRGESPVERLLDAGERPLPLLRRWIERHALEALAEELGGGAPYPTALAGGRVALTLALAYDVSTLSWRRDELTLSLAAEPFGCFEGDEPLWTLAAERQVPLPLLPDGAAELLARARWPLLETGYRGTAG